MPTGYTMNWSDNTLKPPFLLPEATVDNHTTSLQLTGKRVVNWGEFLNENMLHLLEHGFSKTAPNNPTIGQLWLDANTGDLKIYTSQLKWNVIKTIPGIGTQTTTPTPLPITSTTTSSSTSTSTSTSTTTTARPTSTTTSSSTSTTTTTPAPTTTTTTTTTTSTTPKPAGTFIWRRPLPGNSAVQDGQFFNGDTYTMYVPVNCTDTSKGDIYVGLPGYDGVESLRFLSGNLPTGMDANYNRYKYQSLTEGWVRRENIPTQVGTYTFVARAIAMPGHVNSRGESIVDVTFTYVVTPN